MKSLLQTFWRDRFGNFAILSGLLMIPVVASVGIALDYVRASNAKAALYGAADAAAAGAVSQASPTFKNGGIFTSDWTKSKAEQDAVSLASPTASASSWRISTPTSRRQAAPSRPR